MIIDFSINFKMSKSNINKIFFIIFITIILLFNKYFNQNYITIKFLLIIILSNIIYKFIIKEKLLFFIISTLVDIILFLIIINLPLSIKANNVLGIKKYLIFFSFFLIIIFKSILILKKIKKSEINESTVFLFLFLLIFILNIWQSTFRYYGDEPYYLLITHSIAYDFDIDLKNNYEKNDYRNFYNFYLNKQPSYEKDNKTFSSHFIGLPILLSLPYRLFGKQGIILAISIISTFFIYSFYKFISLYYPNNLHNKILLIVILLLFTAPFLEMYASIYPEICAASILLLLFTDFKKDNTNIFKHSFCFLLLALLGIKYLPTACFIWFLLAKNYYKKNNLFLFCLMTLFIFFIQQSINYFAYGEIKFFELLLVYSKYSNNFLFNVIPSQFYQLFFGQRYGLFFCAPIYFLAIYSIIKNIRTNYLELTIFTIHFLPFMLLNELPGDSPPVRYFISALPFLTFYLFDLIIKNFYNKKVLKYSFFVLYLINTIYSLFYLILPFYRNKITGYNNFIYFIKTYILKI